MEAKDQNYCVILAGGIGSRLWPVSRKELPKQFLDWFGTGRTLLQQTYDRFRKIIDTKHIFNRDQRALCGFGKGTVAGCGTRQNIERTYPAEHLAERGVGYDVYQPPLSARQCDSFSRRPVDSGGEKLR